MVRMGGASEGSENTAPVVPQLRPQVFPEGANGFQYRAGRRGFLQSEGVGRKQAGRLEFKGATL